MSDFEQDNPRDTKMGPGEPESQRLSDGSTTWRPSQNDPFEDDEFWDDTPPPTPAGEGRDTQRTTRMTANLADIWGDEFDEAGPGATLKFPREGASMADIDAQLSQAQERPDLSDAGYDLLDVLGKGGVGIVYQARQKSIDRTIAVKMIKPDVGESDHERAKFISEAMVTGALDHPNIVPIHDLGQTGDGRPFYAMKLVRGTPWHKSIRVRARAENVRILMDVCDAVAFAHAKGVIHRDLKPENVMLGEFGEVQLMDWGLGMHVGEDGVATSTISEQNAGGTPAYMAPEMVTGDDGPVGVHSDVYLLGAILYEIITGRPPHPGKRVLDCLQYALENVIEPTEERGALVDIARKAMATAPSDRYRTVVAFKQALVDYQNHAESINLAQQAASELRQAEESQNYELYSQSLFGFRKARELWPGNDEACSGIRRTQLAFARCAFEKGDLDLAASTLDARCSGHKALAAEIAVARERRDSSRRRLRLMRNAAIGLTAAVVVILTVASIWIAIAKRQAEQAREVAVAAQHEEARQRQVAERATEKAQLEESRAVQALADLEEAVRKMMAARDKEARAKAQAAAAELVATKTRDELARTGMLLDNSWWVFDGAAAQRKQHEAAERLGIPVEREVVVGEGTSIDFVLIPPGEFVMGSPPSEEQRAAEEHLHRVELGEAFYLAKFELTGEQVAAVLGGEAGDGGLHPAAKLTVEEVVSELLPRLQATAPDGWRFCLPTEAQWEFACRAGSATAYCAGEDADALDAVGWHVLNSERTVRPVGGKAPNAFGLYDMHGNVSEVCADGFDPHAYLTLPVEDPLLSGDGEKRVVRGGSVMNMPKHCRSAYRSYVYVKNAYEFVGVRPALERVTK